MKQIVLEKPGQFTTREVATPRPQPGEALIRINRIGVCGTDLHAFAGKQPFFEYPRVLGHELGVVIEEVGENEFGLQSGDRCAVEPYLFCKKCVACRRGKTNCCTQMRVLGIQTDGAMSPFITIPTEKLHVSKKLTVDQLALVETLGIGAHAIERAAPEPGENLLVIGAGPIGLGVMQFALAAGANVIAMDINDGRLEFCKNVLGVPHTINPQNGEVDQQLRELLGGELPTALLDATGHPASMQKNFEWVDHGGKIVFVGLFIGDVTFYDPNFHRRELTLLASRNATSATFRQIIDMIEVGTIDTDPWITHRLAFDDVVGDFAGLPKKPNLIKAMIDVQ
jgi:2-desacetyl-2-hydroxyethyl bacteriochlorophyllide A dehydrogenase